MPRLSGPITVFGLGVVLLVLGLANRDLVHCSRLDPGHPIALSNYFEARGFPFAWQASDDGTCGDLAEVPGRILWDNLFRSAVFCTIVAVFVGLVARVIERRGSRSG